MIYFNSRYLSQCMNINLAKWKRWVREFLAPDPLSGMQSGYARNLNLKDAFFVYLAGFLVSELRLSIDQAKQLMTDIEPLLKQQGFQTLHTAQRPDPHIAVWIAIYPIRTSGLGFVPIVDSDQSCHADAKGLQAQPCLRIEHPIRNLLSTGKFVSARLIAITDIYNQFVDRIDSTQYPTKNQA